MLIVPGVEADAARLVAICDKCGIAELKVFGSRARGRAAPDSDIDIFYTLRPRATAHQNRALAALTGHAR